MDGRVRLISALFAFGLILVSPWAEANQRARPRVEVSAMLAYSKSDFADGYRSMQRRYSGTMEFKFTSVSSIQLEYTDSITKVSYQTRIGTLLPQATTEAITYKDRIYSFNWVQNLVPQKWILQPYFVFGGGRMVRNYRREINEYGYVESASQKVETGVGGVGTRLFLTQNMALKGEVKTYVPRFQFSRWKENQMFSLGLSWLF
jgi:hypothetical protein